MSGFEPQDININTVVMSRNDECLIKIYLFYLLQRYKIAGLNHYFCISKIKSQINGKDYEPSEYEDKKHNETF